MTDAPKRIWAQDTYGSSFTGGGWWDDYEPHRWHESLGITEYTRTDLYLQLNHRDLMRAAFTLCLSLQPGKVPGGSAVQKWSDLWALCKDYDPTEE